MTDSLKSPQGPNPKRRIRLINPVGGNVVPKPELAKVPTDFPQDFPRSLRTRASLVMLTALDKFPYRPELKQLCVEIATRMTNPLCDAVKEGAMREDEAAPCLSELLRYVCVETCLSNDEWYAEIKSSVIQSREWKGLLNQLVGCEPVRSSDEAAHATDAAEPAAGADNSALVVKPQEHNEFRKAGPTWRLSFAGQFCSLPQSRGLEYIAELLRNPGVPLKPLELQSLLPENASVATGGVTERSLESLNEEVDTTDEDDRSRSTVSGRDFTKQAFLDPKSRTQIETGLKTLEQEATDAFERGDVAVGNQKQSEYDKLQRFLDRNLDHKGRSRTFSSADERARSAITQALRRAYDKIRTHVPALADYLTLHIETGSVFVYRDNTADWIL